MFQEPAESRSRTMRAVRSRDTGTEMVVRRAVHRLGGRYRLHRTDLPGTPDMVFPARRKVIFVHGCFWHGHDCRRGNREPKANAVYWRAKIDRNRQRDSTVCTALTSMGWDALIVWECETRDRAVLEAALKGFLFGDVDRADDEPG